MFDLRTKRQVGSEVVHALVDAWNSHDPDRISACYTAECDGSDVAVAGRLHGAEAMRQLAGRYLAAFPDLCLIELRTVIQGDQVAVSWLAHGTHSGALMNIPATGRRVQVEGVSLLTILDGKVAQAQHIWDVAGLLRGIGLLPEL